MKKADLLSTLFVGIDSSSREKVVALLDFESSKPILPFAVANNQPSTVDLAQKLADFLSSNYIIFLQCIINTIICNIISNIRGNCFNLISPITHGNSVLYSF